MMLTLRCIACNLSLWSPAAARNRPDFQARRIGDENRVEPRGGRRSLGGFFPPSLREEPGHLSFVLRGHKLTGRFGLTRTGERRWILIKASDDLSVVCPSSTAHAPRRAAGT